MFCAVAYNNMHTHMSSSSKDKCWFRFSFCAFVQICVFSSSA